MKIYNTFCKLTGKELINMITDDGSATEIDGGMVILTPRTLPFANQAEIASAEQASHVGVRKRYADNEILIKI